MSINLSICIPTYNRADCLKECLNSILSSIKGLEEQVEIIISNNASTDNTEDVALAFQKEYSYIRYHRNEVNIGPERNFYAVAEMALGEFIWIFGDDDKVNKEAIPEIMTRIKSGYNLIITNYSIWSNDFSINILSRYFPLKRDKDIANHNELMSVFDALGYISSIIIKKALFFRVSFEEYIFFSKYYCSLLYLVCIGMINECNATYISSPLLCYRSANSKIPHLFESSVIGCALLLEELYKKGYSKKAVNIAKHRLIRNFGISIIAFIKIEEDINLMYVIRSMYPHYKREWLFWVVCLPILFTPKMLLRPVKNIFKTIRGSYRLLINKTII